MSRSPIYVIMLSIFLFFAGPALAQTETGGDAGGGGGAEASGGESSGGGDSAEFQSAMEAVDNAAARLAVAQEDAYPSPNDGSSYNGTATDDQMSELKSSANAYREAYSNLEQVGLREGQPVTESGMDYFFRTNPDRAPTR